MLGWIQGARSRKQEARSKIRARAKHLYRDFGGRCWRFRANKKGAL